MLGRTWAVVISGFVIAAGCASIAGIEETTTIAPDASLGTGPDAAEEGGEDGDVPVTPDGGVVSDAAVSDVEEMPEASPVDAAACADPGKRVKPVSAQRIEPVGGNTCGSASAVFTADDVTVGLDYEDGTQALTFWDDKLVHGCVGVQFDGTGGPYAALLVRAGMKANACGHACTPGTGCNSFKYFGVFYKKANGSMGWLTTVPCTRSLADYVVKMDPAIVGANPYIAICRSSLNKDRDDVEVDYVAACP